MTRAETVTVNPRSLTTIKESNMNFFGTENQPHEDNPLYETWILYEMVKCLEETILEIASAQKSDRDNPLYKIGDKLGVVKQEAVDKVIASNQEKIKELKGKLEQKLN